MNLSPIIVAKDEDKSADRLVEQLTRLNIPAAAGHIPTDYLFTVGTDTVMGENKTPEDLISSTKDGRLHKQVAAMEGHLGFFIIESNCWSSDGGYSVGSGEHAWPYDNFDNLLWSLQEEGIQIIHSPGEQFTARRLAALYNRFKRGEGGSWHTPVALLPPARDYLDSLFREQVGLLMHVGRNPSIKQRGMGPKLAAKMLREFGLAKTLGITEDGLNEAELLWKTVDGVGKKLVKDWREWLIK